MTLDVATITISNQRGPQGTQGSQGADGDAGGNQGPQGNQGTQGVQGAVGAQGTQGHQGFQGTAGAQGSNGTQGTQGFQGANGAQGNQGFQGNQGTQGNQGNQGNQGSAVASGITFTDSGCLVITHTNVQQALTDLDTWTGTARLKDTPNYTSDPGLAGSGTYINRIRNNYTMTTANSDLEEVFSGTGGTSGAAEKTAWRNEAGMFRGTPASYYKDDAVVRAVQRGDLAGTETGGAFELVNNARTTTMYARRWVDGNLVRNGNIMADTIVLSSGATVPTGTPAGTVIVRTP